MKKETNIDDIAEAISLLAVNIDERFDQVDQRFEKVDQRFEKIETRLDSIDSQLNEIRQEQRLMREWLERIDSSVNGLNSDMTEVYDRIVALENQAPISQKAQQELQEQFEKMFDWARQVAKKTGVTLPKL